MKFILNVETDAPYRLSLKYPHPIPPPRFAAAQSRDKVRRSCESLTGINDGELLGLENKLGDGKDKLGAPLPTRFISCVISSGR